MIDKSASVLVSNMKIKGNITEKESLVIDGEITGNIDAETVKTNENSNIKGNISAGSTVVGGKIKGDITSNKVHIKKTADMEGTIKQKTLSIEEGSILRIKTEIKK